MVYRQNYSPPMRLQPPRQCRRISDIHGYRDNDLEEQHDAHAGASDFTRSDCPSNKFGYTESVGSFAVAPSRSPSPAPSSQNSFSTTSSEDSVRAYLFPKYPKNPIIAEPSWEIPATGHFNRVNPRYAHMLNSLGLPQGYEDIPRPTGSETSTEIIDGGSVSGSSHSTVRRAPGFGVISDEDVNNQIEEDRQRAINRRLFATARSPQPAGAPKEYAYFGMMMAQQQERRSLWQKAGLQIDRITTFFEVLRANFSLKKVCSSWVFSRAEFLLLVIVGSMVGQFMFSYFK